MRRNKLSPCIWKPWSEIRIRIDSLSHKPKPIKAVIKTIQHKFANPISFRHKKHTHKYINRSVQFLTWKRKNYFPSYSSYFFCGRDQALVEICYCFRRIRKSLSHRAVSFCFCFFVHRISRNCFLCLYFLKFLRFFFGDLWFWWWISSEMKRLRDDVYGSSSQFKRPFGSSRGDS